MAFHFNDQSSGDIVAEMDDSSSSYSSESEVAISPSSGSDLINTHPTSASVLGKMILFGERDVNESSSEVWAVTRRSFMMNSDPNSGSSEGLGLLDAAASVAASVVSGMMEINNTQGDAGHLGDAVGDDMNDTLAMTPPSYWPVRDPLYITIPITVIYVIILILGLLGNVTTCIVIIRSRYLHTTTNYYLFSLAVSDLLLLLSGLPAEMHSIWRRYPDVFGEVFCVGRGMAAETSSNATVLTITAFTIERYLAICRPFMIQKWQNKLSRVVRQILVIWGVSIALAIPQALQFGLDTMPIGPNKTTVICTVKKVVIEHSFEIATFVFFVGPMILITALYCLIGLTLRNASRVKEGKLRLRKSLSGHKREVGQQRVLKMLVAVVVAFFVCWAPFHSQRLIAIWGTRLLDHNEIMKKTYHILTYISGVLYYMSTCINPILYSIMSKKFRRSFQDNVNKCCGDQAQKKTRGEMLLKLNQRSLSHSSHTQSQSRSQNAIVLTDITAIAVTNHHGNGQCVQSIHHHHHCHHAPGPNLQFNKYGDYCEAVDI